MNARRFMDDLAPDDLCKPIYSELRERDYGPWPWKDAPLWQEGCPNWVNRVTLGCADHFGSSPTSRHVARGRWASVITNNVKPFISLRCCAEYNSAVSQFRHALYRHIKQERAREPHSHRRRRI